MFGPSVTGLSDVIGLGARYIERHPGNAAGSIIPSPIWPVLPTSSAVDSDCEDRIW